MDVNAWLMVLFVGVQCIQCSVGQTGCKKWTQKGNDSCCESCHPGNHLVKECGRDPAELCKPCEFGRFTVKPKSYSCELCTQCVGAQKIEKICTATTDTVCGCKPGLACGNAQCSFCVDECPIGFEPTDDRSCKECPHGTFNDKVHQKCKPWSVKCANANEVIEAEGNTLHDIKCVPVSVSPVTSTKAPGFAEPTWSLVSVIGGIAVLAIATTITIFIMMLLVKNLEKRKKKKTSAKQPIIRTPTDEPRTLIAIECSFHEAQQEEGSTCSLESLDSKDSSQQLIA